jgi:serine/threonine protein kinase
MEGIMAESERTLELVERARRGDGAAFEALASRSHPRLEAFKEDQVEIGIEVQVDRQRPGGPICVGQIDGFSHSALAIAVEKRVRSADEVRVAIGIGSGGQGDLVKWKTVCSNHLSTMPTPPRILGDFELLHELGRGGMGVVYRARQISLNRPVALKVLSGGLGLTPRAVQRFRREAEAAGRLHHTNIVPIYATGEADGIHYYAMELVAGPSLDQAIAQMRTVASAADPGQETASVDPRPAAPLDDPQPAAGPGGKAVASSATTGGRAPGESTTSLGTSGEYFDSIARRLAEVAEALDYAHKNGVIHRDIKPSNLLLSPDGRVSINDFGLARMLEEPGMTVTGEFMGSPGYMSPEQITAGRAPLDHRTDIYSLGATLYEALTLEPPFRGERRDQVIAQVVHKEPRAPRKLNKKVPLDLETICLKAMDKDPDLRYQSGAAMAEDLRRFVNRFAIAARPLGPVQRVVKWAKRHPALAAALAVALLAGLAAVGFAIEATRAQEHARDQARRSAIERATLIARSGDLDATEKAIGEAELLDASPGQLRFLRGEVAFFRGDYEQAVQHLEQSARLQSRSVSTLALLAQAYLNAGQVQKYLDTMGSLEHLTPATAEDRLLLGAAQVFLSPVEGLPMLDEAIRQQDSPLARLFRASARADYAMDTGDPAFADLALQDTALADSMMPHNPAVCGISVWNHLVAGVLWDGKDDRKRDEAFAHAAWDAEAALQFPGSPAAIGARLCFLRYQRKPELYEYARRAYEEAGDPVAAWYYPLALWEQGKFAAAAEVLERIRRKIPLIYPSAFVLAELPDGPKRAMAFYRDLMADSSFRSWTGILIEIPLVLGKKAQAVADAREKLKDRSLFLQLNRTFLVDQLRFQADEIGAEELIRSAGKSRRNQVVAHFCIGCMRLAEGRRDEAKDCFQRAVATGCFYFAEFDWGLAFLQRLEKDPGWPRSIQGE